ncbi:hypothetical protein PHPALM_18092 [Phytophthora palmivora]|uniref:Uncharacterized protein n=1 Tax=Phytophthora palmivora TaxID=4796 RepID=A0A2P4XKN8_9STRA|nr:hypothetical protein PHPALM_18092 [Phytophthora palmivora]
MQRTWLVSLGQATIARQRDARLPKPLSPEQRRQGQEHAKGKAAQKPKPVEGTSMKWTVQLSALAIDARFRNKRILKKFSTKNSNTQARRKYPEMPVDFLINGEDEYSDDSSADGDAPQNLTCDPLSVNPNYLKILGPELTDCYVKLFSRRTGCTGEAITETGIDSDDGVNNEHESGSEPSESPSEAHEARERAKAAAKARKTRDTQANKSSTKRPSVAVCETLQSGFEAIERVFSNRHQPLNLQQLTASLFSEITKRSDNFKVHEYGF